MVVGYRKDSFLKVVNILKKVVIFLFLIGSMFVMFFIRDIKEVSKVSVIPCEVVGIDRDLLFGQKVIVNVEGVEKGFFFRYVDNLNISDKVYCDVTKIEWRFDRVFYVLGDFSKSFKGH